jgi:hypothetical protein
MTYISVTEAMKRLGKSDRQVRRMAHDGKLTWRHIPDTKGKRLEILSSDVDRLSRHALPAQELERLDRLEQELIQLREQLDTLSSRVDTFTATREIRPQKSIVRPITPPSAPGEGLPDGYVPIFDLIKEHGLTRQRNAIMRYMRKYGYLKTGHWNVGGHEVKNALDQEGVKEFMEGFVQS